MLRRFAIASGLVALFAQVPANAVERDRMQRGEKELTADWEIKYDRAVRHVLSLGWHSDVVLRMVDLPPFQPEWVVGIANTPAGYCAFEVTASKQIWGQLPFGSDDPKHHKGDYHSVRPILHEKLISDALSRRIAAVWRRVLADPRNYGKETGIILDTDQFTYYLSSLPRERLTANVAGWGPHSEKLIDVAGAIANYANGAPEREVVKAVMKAERELGI